MNSEKHQIIVEYLAQTKEALFYFLHAGKKPSLKEIISDIGVFSTKDEVEP